jgi:Tfp pilus assembly protein FimT
VLFDRHRLAAYRGYSATETMLMLAVMALLTGGAAPTISDSIEHAKLVRARHDVSAISTSLIRLSNDVGTHATHPGHWTAYTLLAGSGDAPGAAAGGDARWSLPATDAGVGSLDDHLVTNRAGYLPPRPPRTLGWRGAYLQNAVSADPWGHRYAVNVAAMREAGADIVVLSAAADGVAASPFDADGLHAPAADIVAVVSAGGVGR